MKRMFLFVLLAICQEYNMYAQKLIKGVVLEESLKGVFSPLVGAPVFWVGNSNGVVTDTNGIFQITVPDLKEGEVLNKLVISYLGFKSDTLDVKGTAQVRVILAQIASKELQEIEISERINATFLNALEPLNTKTMTEKELFKAACCNLSESFETNPSVDVSYGDAVTGAKQIQMLGLSGIYNQMTSENMPSIRGIGSSYGMGFIPGTWIESIQLTKGVGSVANGFESMSGQINVELKKTDISAKIGERVYANAYLNSMGRAEANLSLTHKDSTRWSYSNHFHISGMSDLVRDMMDRNKDGFYDIPMGVQVNGMNRWKYEGKNGLLFQVGIKALADSKVGGTLPLDEIMISDQTIPKAEYRVDIRNYRTEAFTKLGYVFPQQKYKSLGWMNNLVYQDQQSKLGLVKYSAQQVSFYSNFIYQSIIQTTMHKYRTGISIAVDEYNENFTQVSSNNYQAKRLEIVPGAFVEYTWTPSQKLVLIGGLRTDYHSYFGGFITPRMHGKWDITEKLALRFSGGRGQRTANIFADNSSFMASSRSWKTPIEANRIGIDDAPLQAISNAQFISSAFAFGLRPEVSWNYGVSLSQDFKLDYRKGNIQVDFYRTDFENQVVVDLDYSSRQILFYNLNGLSFANSFQTEFNYELVKRLDIRLAYRFYDVKTTYHGELLDKPFVSKHRAFMNLAYETKSKWKFDFTLNWNGSKRLPNSSQNPSEYQWRTYSPDYFTINTQISKSLGNPMKHWWDIYLGIENATDFRQQDLIVSANQPFNSYFDAAMVWGPVIGRMVYIGGRYKLK